MKSLKIVQISIILLTLFAVSYQYPCVSYNSTHCVHYDFPKLFNGNSEGIYISAKPEEALIAADPFQKDQTTTTVYKIASNKKCVNGYFAQSQSPARNVSLSHSSSCETDKVYPYDTIAQMTYELPKGDIPEDGKFQTLKMTTSDPKFMQLAVDGQTYSTSTTIDLICSEFNIFNLVNIQKSGNQVNYFFTFYTKAGCGIIQKKSIGDFNGLLALLQEYWQLVLVSSLVIFGTGLLTIGTLCLGGCCLTVLFGALAVVAYRKLILEPALYRKKVNKKDGTEEPADNNEIFLVPAGRTNYETPQQP